MPYEIDETHDPSLESWVESANDPATDFPIQNLPLCAFAPAENVDDGTAPIHVGVLIGDQVLSLSRMQVRGMLDEWERSHGVDGWFALNSTGVDAIAELDAAARRDLRRIVSRLLRSDAPDRAGLGGLLEPREGVLIQEPLVTIGDYTDFYASVHHATNVGTMFRPDNPLMPNYKWLPVGYHGRASSVVPSGTPIRRPKGQLAPANEGEAPAFGPSRLLDYELEIGAFVARGNDLGEPISIEEAEDHLLGLCLLNDWSARDIQRWEYQPLGPFLAKNFATSISPYIVTMEALAPFRVPREPRPEGDPQPLPHLDSEHDRTRGGFDITLEVHLASKQMRDRGMAPVRLSRGNFRTMYWTFAQMLTHHASSGCNMRPGDLIGSGTVSGPERSSRGCLLELTWNGGKGDPRPGTDRTPIELPTGEQRRFLEDGDEVILRGYCEREGFRRIGFGECRGIIEPAV